jgi:hypothetical protein
MQRRPLETRSVALVVQREPVDPAPHGARFLLGPDCACTDQNRASACEKRPSRDASERARSLPHWTTHRWIEAPDQCPTALRSPACQIATHDLPGCRGIARVNRGSKRGTHGWRRGGGGGRGWRLKERHDAELNRRRQSCYAHRPGRLARARRRRLIRGGHERPSAALARPSKKADTV